MTQLRCNWMLVLAFSISAPAWAQTYTTLYSFTGLTDGGYPGGSLAMDANGALYGVTAYGGASGQGTVFSLTPPASPGGSWTQTVIYNFGVAASGTAPTSIVFGGQGVLYGTTVRGGAHGQGTIFSLAPPSSPGGAWVFTAIHSLAHPANPGLTVGSDGTIYGTIVTLRHGRAGGTAFALTPPAAPDGAWTDTTLWQARGHDDDLGPNGGLVMDGGKLYGTSMGCAYVRLLSPEACGRIKARLRGGVFELSPPDAPGGKWEARTLTQFKDTKSPMRPVAGLTLGPDGAFYGVSELGGNHVKGICGHGCGTVFKMIPPATKNGKWTRAVIFRFTNTTQDTFPYSALTIGKHQELFGSLYGGPNGWGVVYELIPPTGPGGAWTQNVLHNFTEQNGDGARATALMMGPTGVLYGVASEGGIVNKQCSYGCGVIFSLTY